MKKSWLTGLTEEQKTELRREFVGSAPLRERLIHILKEKIDSNRRSQISTSSYDSPSWPYLQADANAKERAYLEIIDLLDSKESE